MRLPQVARVVIEALVRRAHAGQQPAVDREDVDRREDLRRQAVVEVVLEVGRVAARVRQRDLVARDVVGERRGLVERIGHAAQPVGEVVGRGRLVAVRVGAAHDVACLVVDERLDQVQRIGIEGLRGQAVGAVVPEARDARGLRRAGAGQRRRVLHRLQRLVVRAVVFVGLDRAVGIDERGEPAGVVVAELLHARRGVGGAPEQVGVGRAEPRDLHQFARRVVAVFGDRAVGGGLADAVVGGVVLVGRRAHRVAVGRQRRDQRIRRRRVAILERVQRGDVAGRVVAQRRQEALGVEAARRSGCAR